MIEQETIREKLHYGPLSALLITVGSFFGSQLLAGVVVSFFPLFIGWDEARIQQWFDNSVLPQTLIIALSGLISILLIRLFLHMRGNRLIQLGLGRPKLSFIWQALAGFAVYMVGYLVLLVAVKALIPALDLEQKQELGFDFSAKENIVLLAFSLVIIPPVVEEIVMRGFLFGGLRTKVPFIFAALGTSLLFAAAHLPAAKDGLLWVGAIDTFVLSMVLCYLREKTGNLWPAIAVHALKNSIALIYLVYLG